MEQNSNEFLLEIEELIEKVFTDLEQLRATSNSQSFHRHLIDQIFRHVHSIKGLTLSAGLAAVGHIAHEFESLLAALRSGRVPLDEQTLQAADYAVEALNESLTLAASGIVEPSRRALFEQLQNAAQPRNAVDQMHGDAVLENIPSDIWQSLSEGEKQRLEAVVREATPVLVVSARFDISNFDDEFFKLREKLTAAGELIATSPAVDPDHADRVNFRILYASAQGDAELQQHLSADASFIRINDKSTSQPAAPKSALTNVPAALGSFVRTDLEKLDRLISSAHELSRLASNALDVAGAAKRSQQAKAELRSLHETVQNSFLRFEKELINLRMVKVGPTLQRAVRAGRIAARAAGKEINFEVIGKDLEVDKVLADALADPLVHLIRNAVDHGIESAAERELAGKTRQGTIRVEAISESAQSRVRVTDDGRGIDPELISAAAMRLGIVERPVDLEHSLRLIFRAGFTTLEMATQLSGRGVGLDVVERAVEQVGGELRVSSRSSAGTTFEIRLPATFGLLEAAVLVSNGNRYCVPANQILQVETSREKAVAKKPVTGEVDRGPVALAELLGQPRPKRARKNATVVTCRISEEDRGAQDNLHKSCRILVDKVEAAEEILVRSLGRHGGRWYGVAGATELRNGQVALVLDLPRLLTSVEFTPSSSPDA